MIRFDWDGVNLRRGGWFAAVTLAVMGLAQFVEAVWMTAGLSALLAWLPLLLTKHTHLRSGLMALLVYLLAGIALSLLAHSVLPSEGLRLAAVGLIALAAGLTLRFGVFWYLTAYVLLFWYVLSPLFSSTIGLWETLEGHIVGSLGLIAYWTISRLRADANAWQAPSPKHDALPHKTCWRYAGVLAATMVAGTGIGGRVLSADPTLMAQASLNIIAPSVDMTWQAGLIRAIFGLGGLLFGFYLGLLFPSIVFYQVVIALCAFVALGFFEVNIGFLTAAFAVMFAYPIGVPGGEAAHAVGNERMLAEILGIGAACIAILLLGRAQNPPPDPKEEAS